MDLPSAWRQLGIGPTDDTDAVRTAYLARLHVLHPDHSAEPDANTATAALTDAYQLVQGHLAARTLATDPVAAENEPEPAASHPTELVPIALVADDTIAVALPASETYALLVEAAHHLGEVTHIEPSSGMLMVVIEFVEAPACQLLLTMQGRATGVTEVFCTVESLEPRPPPPVAAVSRVLLDEVVAASRRDWSLR